MGKREMAKRLYRNRNRKLVGSAIAAAVDDEIAGLREENTRLRDDRDKFRALVVEFLGVDNPVRLVEVARKAADALGYKTVEDFPEEWRNQVIEKAQETGL